MKHYFPILLGLLLMLHTAGFSQNQDSQKITRTEDKLRNDLTYGGVIEQTAPLPRKNLGTHYYDTRWRGGTIELFDGKKAKDVLIKYELKNQQLELIFKGGDKRRSIRPELVRRFTWRESAIRERTFVNPKLMQYSLREDNLKGFVEALYEGEYALYAHHTATLEEGYYVAIFDMGEKDNSWEKKVTLWLKAEDTMYPFPKRKKKIMELFDEVGIDYDEVKFRDYNYKTPEGARKLMRFINEGY